MRPLPVNEDLHAVSTAIATIHNRICQAQPILDEEYADDYAETFAAETERLRSISRSLAAIHGADLYARGLDLAIDAMRAEDPMPALFLIECVELYLERYDRLPPPGWKWGD